MKKAAILSGSILIFIAGCGSSATSDNDVSSGTSVNPLDTPATATCQNWLDATQSERDAASLRFVKALKGFDQSNDFAHDFAVDISKDCDAGPALKLAEVVGALATLDTEDFPH